MNSGIVYVIYNESIRDSESKKLLYKIGYTKGTISDRYYGIGLKMPGKFETLFAYKFENCIRSEKIIHDILNKKRVKGEWFKISQKEVDLIKNICETMGAEIITDEIGNRNADEIYEIDKIFDDNYKDESYENIYIVKENGEEILLDNEGKKRFKNYLFKEDLKKYKNDEYILGKDENDIIHGINNDFQNLTFCIENPYGTLFKEKKWMGKVKEITCKNCLDHLFFASNYWNKIETKVNC